VASLTELTQWEASIYQIETLDNVIGGNDGISNRQGKQLANRTAYLKQQVELKAPLKSPVFTDVPKVPTAEADTDTTQIASTEFVIGQAANVAPVMDGVAAAGTSKKFARQDHVHPKDTSKVSISDLQAGVYNFATDTGAANAYVVSMTPALAERREGQVIRFKVANTNNGASTINDGISVVPLVGDAHAALQGGELVAGGEASAQWNSTVGTGSYVLLLCTGAPVQVANGNKSQHAATLSQITSVVGSSRNVMMSVTAASASATLTADEIVVETALGGLKYQLSNFSKTINLATTGAGGMDTGTAPVSGFVALYIILNTTTGASALLATNATSAKATEVYSGANMPSGYTASALLSVWPTNASGQFVAGYQTDRRLCTPSSTIINSTQSGTSNPLSAVSCAGAVPKNAKRIILSAGIFNNTSSGTYSSMSISPASTVGSVSIGGYSAPNIGSCSEVIIDLVTAQTIWISIYASSGTATYSVSCVGYEI
jgi:hypothetical protein